MLIREEANGYKVMCRRHYLIHLKSVFLLEDSLFIREVTGKSNVVGAGAGGELELNCEAKETGLRRKVDRATSFYGEKVPERFPEMRMSERVQNKGVTHSFPSSLLCCRPKDINLLYCPKAIRAAHTQPCVGSAL